LRGGGERWHKGGFVTQKVKGRKKEKQAGEGPLNPVKGGFVSLQQKTKGKQKKTEEKSEGCAAGKKKPRKRVGNIREKGPTSKGGGV